MSWMQRSGGRGGIVGATALLCLLHAAGAHAQQISVPRIELMPKRPSPYLMRDWKSVARQYDSLVFDQNLSGTYLPLVWLNATSVNYPDHGSFGLHTVVGTSAPASAEAINCLPALVSARLVGLDKSSQNGIDWVLMAEEWFNRRPSQNVYKNHPVDDTGDDWWYETMPNVFFYQLYSLYPTTGDFPYQFTTVADRWLQSVQAMGGSATPWTRPNMDHRGWYLQTMTPYDADVHEPEAAGALAWLFYMAYRTTHEDRYRLGAEWAMEFLNRYASNPSYELQLPYGALTAARMNAELGTVYDEGKIVNWCFDIGPLRSWGAMVGTWGGYDCSGLVGEVNGVNDYAFAMNTFEQVGALVPLVRYDARFARAIGRWVLNAANASRLFYTGYLPDDHQDSEQWAHQYDSTSVIAHEALRQNQGGVSPYATGDAISGGWGSTNLALYGSSHAGILGAVIETTNVPMVLRLDLLATDYFHDSAYPSYLFYNPHDTGCEVAIDVGGGLHDLYDAVRHTFFRTAVSGLTTVTLPADSAAVVVVTPSGGVLSSAQEKLSVDGVAVDYHSGVAVANYPPRIKALAAQKMTLLYGDTVRVYCTAEDRDGGGLTYSWGATGGAILGSDSSVQWIAPDSDAIVLLTCIVTDAGGARDTATIQFQVQLYINHPPVIAALTALPRKIDLGAASSITCTATDADSDALTYSWRASSGTLSGADSVVSWTSPAAAGNYYVVCHVSDGQGGEAEDSVGIEVRDFSQHQTGQMVAYYPFTGNPADSSGWGNNGVVHGALLAADRQGTPLSAYSFNGSTSYIEVANSASLNFQNAITVAFWMSVGAFYNREQYPISHGNWEHRWKVSISNNRLRWTVKTTSGVKDLDSETLLDVGRWHHVAVLYDGSDVEVYLDGQLDAFTSWSGTILTTSIALTIGQVLPNNQGYNFNGLLDDVRVYDYALSVADIEGLVGPVSATGDEDGEPLPTATALAQNFPNPFNPSTVIRYALSSSTGVSLNIYDIFGRVVATLVHETQAPGTYAVTWQAASTASGVYFCRLSTSTASFTRKLLLLH